MAASANNAGSVIMPAAASPASADPRAGGRVRPITGGSRGGRGAARRRRAAAAAPRDL